ncbi:MAG: HAD-IA family hydrolase [Methylococcales bacterium]|nr:HAD-IA family hydrolase [Methylococcales bacterium]
MPLTSIFFDLDGTLVDTAPDLINSLNRVRVKANLPEIAHELLRPYVSFGSKVLVDQGITEFKDKSRLEELRLQLLDDYEQNIAVHSRLFDGMEQVLQTIEDSELKWGVITNKPARFTLPLMQRLHLDKRSACIVSGDTTSRSKPHPKPMLHACELTQSLAKNCLYIGDAARDIEAGKNAGMQTMAALFGYILPDENPNDWNADYQVNHPLKINEWIQQYILGN